MRYIYYILIIQVVTGTPAFAQHKKSNRQYTIPFRLTEYNNIVLKAVLNNTDTVQLMLHTASSDVTVTDEAAARFKNTRFNGTVDSVKSWGGSNNSADYSHNNAFRIGELSWNNITVWKDKNSGQHTDGKFGLNFFGNKTIEIDFNHNLFIVHDDLPRKAKKYARFPLVVKNDNLFIEATCRVQNDIFSNLFLIHSGYGGAVLLDDAFTAQNAIGQRVTITGEKKLKDAYGNVIVTKTAQLPVFSMGKMQLSNVTAGFFEGAIGRQKMSVIGGEIIKRFNWIIDIKNKYVYLEPAKYFKAGFSIT